MSLSQKAAYGLFCLSLLSLTHCGKKLTQVGLDCPNLQGSWYQVSAKMVSDVKFETLELEEKALGEQGDILAITQNGCKGLTTKTGKISSEFSPLEDPEYNYNGGWQGVTGFKSTNSYSTSGVRSINFNEGTRESGITVITEKSNVEYKEGYYTTVTLTAQYVTKSEYDKKFGLEARLEAERKAREKAEAELEELKKAKPAQK